MKQDENKQDWSELALALWILLHICASVWNLITGRMDCYAPYYHWTNWLLSAGCVLAWAALCVCMPRGRRRGMAMKFELYWLASAVLCAAGWIALHFPIADWLFLPELLAMWLTPLFPLLPAWDLLPVPVLLAAALASLADWALCRRIRKKTETEEV